jgi:hypothetical protein
MWPKSLQRSWNNLLQEQVAQFASNTWQANFFLFSSHQVLTEALDDVVEFGLSEDGPTTEGSGIWEDFLHLTEMVHDILAHGLYAPIFSPS